MQTLTWGSVIVSFPGAWLPPGRLSLALEVCLPPGLLHRTVSPIPRVAFTRRIWLAPAR